MKVNENEEVGRKCHASIKFEKKIRLNSQEFEMEMKSMYLRNYRKIQKYIHTQKLKNKTTQTIKMNIYDFNGNVMTLHSFA